MWFVCKIHNNSLGNSFLVPSIEAGIEEIKKMAIEQFGRELYNYEIEEAENDYELYNNDDMDNIYSFSLGQLEN
ncbi:MAG TPA: hypothetical protein PLF17_09820 [Chitinophagaceae bacterium]|nr:hypothetical protein [Chitinophagaceae bacterium]